jgi:hypothetical protein
MIKANVKFYGKETGQFGMPKPYNSYLVVASPWQINNSGVATAMPLSGDAPAPNPPHKISQSGGPEKAYEDMLDILRNLTENKGLQELIDKE